MKRLAIVILLACLTTFIVIASKGIIASAMAPFPPTPPPPPEEGERVSVEKSILEAVAAHQGDVLGYLVYQVRVGNIRFSSDGNWATAWLGMFDPELNDMLPTEPGLAIARREGDSWVVTLQADANWLDIFNSIPVDLMAEDEREVWLISSETHLDNIPAAPLQGYLLPWPKGISRNLSQSVGHDQYTPSGSMHYAFDFYTHDVMWNIYSSKAGTVWKYKYNVPTCFDPTCADTQPLGNYIVLKDTTTNPISYQLYLHLAYESIPAALRQVGAYVAQGQFIGVADNTGQSWGDHLHFQVHTYPYSYFGTAVDIVFGDVDINGGRPRVKEYDQNYCKSSDVCQNFRVSYVSGNEIAGDIVPPTGDITSPLTWETVSTPQLSIAGWASDIGLGVDSIQIMEKHAGTWYDIGPVLTVSPFSFSWDWCENSVPDGALDLALRITDKEGNLTQYAGMKHFTKNYACPTPPPSCLPNEDQVSLYADVNYQGACKKFNVGVYTNTVSLGDLYKNAASIKVGTNVLVTLSKRPNLIKKPLFGETFSLDVPNLINTRVGVDTVQSLQVWLRPTTPQVPTPVWPPDYFIYTETHSLSLDWEYPWAATQFQARLITVPGGTITTSWQTDPYWNPGSLVPGAYIWQVRASINPGTWMTPTHLTIVTDTMTIPPTYTFPYSETMEGGLNGWSGTGLWNRENNIAHNSSFAWWFGETIEGVDQYSTQKIGDLTSPFVEINSSLQTTYYLRFWYRYDTETQNQKWDQRWVQISIDGSQFENIYQLSDDPMNYWLRSPAIPISLAAGTHMVQVRFHFDAMDLRFNNRSGWYIDDVSISSQGPAPCAPDGNDDPANATLINYDSLAINGEICPEGDIDFYKFFGSAGDRIVVDIDAQTLDPTSPLDALLYLLANDGNTILAIKDDEISGELLDPKLGYQLQESGAYYLKVLAWDNPSVGGSDYIYQLRLYKDESDPLAWISNPVNGSYVRDGQVELTASVIDTLSGAENVDFFYHSDDWIGSSWDYLGTDSDGLDGWNYPFTTTLVAEGNSMAFYIHAYDWAGNWVGAGVWNVRVDRTPPTVTMNTLTTEQSSTAFLISWLGIDTQSGIDHYDLLMKINNGSWQDYGTGIPGSGIWMIGQLNYSYSFQVRAVDRAGNISPWSAETSTHIPANICTDPDAWETDNDKADASLVTPNDSGQIHSFCNPVGGSHGLDDVDWIKFTAQAGEHYLVQGIPQAANAALTIILYDVDGTTELMQKSSSEFGEDLGLNWDAPADGTYYLKVMHSNGAVAGNDVKYGIWIFEGYRFFMPFIQEATH